MCEIPFNERVYGLQLNLAFKMLTHFIFEPKFNPETKSSIKCNDIIIYYCPFKYDLLSTINPLLSLFSLEFKRRKKKIYYVLNARSYAQTTQAVSCGIFRNEGMLARFVQCRANRATRRCQMKRWQRESLRATGLRLNMINMLFNNECLTWEISKWLLPG